MSTNKMPTEQEIRAMASELEEYPRLANLIDAIADHLSKS